MGGGGIRKLLGSSFLDINLTLYFLEKGVFFCFVEARLWGHGLFFDAVSGLDIVIGWLVNNILEKMLTE